MDDDDLYCGLDEQLAAYLDAIFPLETVMADKKIVVELEVIERLWFEKALQTQKASLVRSLTKELQGSDIYRLRQQEIGAIDKLILKVATAGG